MTPERISSNVERALSTVGDDAEFAARLFAHARVTFCELAARREVSIECERIEMCIFVRDPRLRPSCSAALSNRSNFLEGA